MARSAVRSRPRTQSKAQARGARPGVRVRSLTLHADYGCGRSGVCCALPWRIRVEPQGLDRMRQAWTEGRLGPEDSGGRSFDAIFRQPAPGLTIIDTDRGGCAFHGGDRCRAHDRAGAQVLPDVCRLFPRLVVRTPRGTDVSLSHFCPTAARMLFRPESDVLRIQTGPAAFPPAGLDGLDARTHAPPLLDPERPMGWVAYELWEREAVARWARAQDAVAGLVDLARGAEWIRGRVRSGLEPEDAVKAWTRRSPDLEPPPTPSSRFELATVVMAPVLSAQSAEMARVAPWLDERRRAWLALDEAERRTEFEADHERVGAAWEDVQYATRRYLAARTFANWFAYQGYGLRSTVFALAAALTVLRWTAGAIARRDGRSPDSAAWVEAFRFTDYMLVHGPEKRGLAQVFGASEQGTGQETGRIAALA